MVSEKKVLAAITDRLHDGETIASTLRAILVVSNSSNANPTGLLALTGERVIFAGVARRETVEREHPLTEIASIEFEHGLLNSFVRVRLAPAPDEVAATYRPDPGKTAAFVAAVENGIESARNRERRPVPDEPSLADELTRLADLHDRGALTDEEFAAAKSRLLGGAS